MIVRGGGTLSSRIAAAFGKSDDDWRRFGCPRWESDARALEIRVVELNDAKRQLEEKLEGDEECYGEDFAAWERERTSYQTEISNLMLTNQELRIENKKQAAELERWRASGVKYPS